MIFKTSYNKKFRETKLSEGQYSKRLKSPHLGNTFYEKYCTWYLLSVILLILAISMYSGWKYISKSLIKYHIICKQILIILIVIISLGLNWVIYFYGHTKNIYYLSFASSHIVTSIICISTFFTVVIYAQNAMVASISYESHDCNHA